MRCCGKPERIMTLEIRFQQGWSSSITMIDWEFFISYKSIDAIERYSSVQQNYIFIERMVINAGLMRR